MARLIELNENLVGQTLSVVTGKLTAFRVHVLAVKPHVPSLSLSDEAVGVELKVQILDIGLSQRERKLYFLRNTNDKFSYDSIPRWEHIHASDEFVVDEAKPGYWAVAVADEETHSFLIQSISLCA